MKKIGGVKMNSTIKLFNKKSLVNSKEYNLYEALEESLKEVKLIKEGKIKPKKWREILNEIGDEK